MPQPPREDPPPYRVYSSRPKGFLAKLRGENDREIEVRAQERARQRANSRQRSAADAYDRARSSLDDERNQPGRRPERRGPGGPGGPSGTDGPGMPGGSGGAGGRGPGRRGGVPSIPHGRLAWLRRPLFGIALLTPLRIIKTVVGFVVFWVALSAVLFVISAHDSAGNLPGGAKSALSGGSPMLVSADTILILGLDNRPTTGYSSKEAGAQYSESQARTDTIMLWRVGGGVSRKLSIPRDTWVDIPGYGYNKINAAWPLGGPALTIRVVEQLTGIKVNHLIVVDLGNFIKFIDDIGGVTVKTPRICSNISGGAADGGYTLNLSPGVHHLNGTQAVTLARTRDMPACNPAYTDLNREAMQQEIMNSIKSQLLTPHTFFHLPWASWDAPKAIQTDMGAVDLAQLFVASEIGGSPKPQLLSETGEMVDGQDALVPNTANVQAQVSRLMTGN